MSVISRDVAEDVLAEIIHTYDLGELGENEEKTLLEVIQSGRLSLEDEEIHYTLAVPVRAESGSIVLSVVKIHEPNGGELERINKGSKIVYANGKGEADMGDQTKKTLRAIDTLSGCGIGVAEKIKNRDLRVLSVLCGFFG